MSRVPVGRLNGLDSEPGTILGPDTAGELMVVLERDERGVTCGYATREDIDNAKDRMAAGEMSRSVCEWGRPGRGWWEQGF